MTPAEVIRNTVLRAMARDRTPGWSFTGHFQELHWPRIGKDSMTITIPVGPQCTDVKGNVELAALLVLFDAALASPTRIDLPVGARLATTHIQAQFTGAAAHDDVSVEAVNQGESAGNMRQLLSRAELTSAGHTVMVGSGAFAQLPPPREVGDMAPLPWQRSEHPNPPPLALNELDGREAAILAACDAALAAHAADPQHSFLRHFWGILPAATPAGAECRIKVGPQLANRVGHVQGGILMGIAAQTAMCAVPNHPSISNISAWFTGPGRGGELLARSWTVHAGRSLAVVRTEITGPDGARVLEATSAHAA